MRPLPSSLSGADAPVRAGPPGPAVPGRERAEADVGVGRGRGRPPHSSKRLMAFIAAASLCLLTSCKMPGEQQDLSKLTEDFVYGSLALSPVGATSAGYHEHNGVKLDEKLDDYSPAGVQEQRQFYSGFKDRLALVKPAALSPEERADFQILQNQTDLALLELREIQSFRHNPTLYVELVGNALFNPFVLDYAPIETRYRRSSSGCSGSRP